MAGYILRNWTDFLIFCFACHILSVVVITLPRKTEKLEIQIVKNHYETKKPPGKKIDNMTCHIQICFIMGCWSNAKILLQLNNSKILKCILFREMHVVLLYSSTPFSYKVSLNFGLYNLWETLDIALELHRRIDEWLLKLILPLYICNL